MKQGFRFCPHRVSARRCYERKTDGRFCSPRIFALATGHGRGSRDDAALDGVAILCVAGVRHGIALQQRVELVETEKSAAAQSPNRQRK